MIGNTYFYDPNGKTYVLKNGKAYIKHGCCQGSSNSAAANQHMRSKYIAIVPQHRCELLKQQTHLTESSDDVFVGNCHVINSRKSNQRHSLHHCEIADAKRNNKLFLFPNRTNSRSDHIPITAREQTLLGPCIVNEQIATRYGFFEREKNGAKSYQKRTTNK